MILSNLLLAVGIVGASAVAPMEPPHTQPQNAVTTTEYEYQYQTNEVNSFDDLIIGNVYKLNYLNLYTDNFFEEWYNNSQHQIYLEYIEIKYTSQGDYWPIIDDYYIDNNPLNQLWTESPTNIYIQQVIGKIENNYLAVILNYYNQNIIDEITIIYEQGFADYYEDLLLANQALEGEEFTKYNWLHKADYLGELVPVETTTNGLYNTIEEFIETYIFNNDKLKETEYTIMGTTYNMAEWLAHTTTMVMMILILAILLYFVKWCFKQISNTFTLIGAN